MSLGPTAAIATFALDTPFHRIPKAAVAGGKRLILDTIACALAASNRNIGRVLTGHALAEGATPAVATILGAGVKISPPMAALVNGTLCHALALEGGNHLPTHILPAAFAVAERDGLSGRDLLAGVILGYEVGLQITRALGRGPTNRGWWHPKLVGPLAAAVSTGRLIGLDHRQMAMAIGIATASSGGFRRNMGTMAQAYHSGLAARDGMEAATLAKRGFTADSAILEQPLGFGAAVCGLEAATFADIADGLGRPYALEKPYAIKPYPVCGPAQPLIQAVVALRRDRSIDLSEIEAVEADLHFFSLLRQEAADEDAAGYSGAFVLAATLVRGDIWIDEIAGPMLHDATIRALMKKVKHVPSTTKGVDKVVLRFKDGKERSAEAKGERTTDLEVGEKKFHRCVERVMPPEQAQDLKAAILDLENQPTLDRLMALTAARR
jgi:2-methylcitrate dehydratase PrpD